MDLTDADMLHGMRACNYSASKCFVALLIWSLISIWSGSVDVHTLGHHYHGPRRGECSNCIFINNLSLLFLSDKQGGPSLEVRNALIPRLVARLSEDIYAEGTGRGWNPYTCFCDSFLLVFKCELTRVWLETKQCWLDSLAFRQLSAWNLKTYPGRLYGSAWPLLHFKAYQVKSSSYASRWSLSCGVWL